MNWQQKALTGLMVGGFGLRWLAGHDTSGDAVALQAAGHAIDVTLGWMLAVGLILGLWALAIRARRWLAGAGGGHG